MENIVNIITTVGFPIAVCLISFWYIYNLTKSHKEETEKLTIALNNNTLVIQQLVDKLNNDQ